MQSVRGRRHAQAELAIRCPAGDPSPVESSRFELFAVTAPGLEALCAAELRALGIAADCRAVAGGVEWRGDLRSCYRANLESRVATRVLVRVGEFRARSFIELERRMPKLPWAALLPAGAQVALRITARKSKLYHERAIAERFTRILRDAHGIHAVPASGDDDEAEHPQLVVIRFFRDECTVSLDSSGVLLHHRGYRQALAKAPLRETLAAAMLLATGWRGDRPLLDPLCGSGTLPIEAALLARNIPPGLAAPDREPRRFAFQEWREFDEPAWRDVVTTARGSIRDVVPVPILGSDRDAGAIRAAVANAERAGVLGDVELQRRGVSEVEPPGADGVLVSNPPYGVRVGERGPLHGLYAALGGLLRERLPNWTVALLVADRGLAAATGLRFQELFATRNGGIPVSCVSHAPAGDGPAPEGVIP